MKRTLSPALLASASLFFASCERPAPPQATPASATPPTTEAVLADERDQLEAEIASLRVLEQEAAYRLLQQQQAELAADRAGLERERTEWERDKEAVSSAAAASVPIAATSEPARSTPTVEPAQPANRPRTVSSPEDRDYQLFYEGLAPYGNWVESDEYGWVWRPAAASESDWRPYTRGRWVDSDQGWAWISDEPFGWATYHYGRWALLLNHGWIWVPGETWAPAWVAWRRNEEAVGWAPLPPETSYSDDITYGPEVEADYGLSAEWYTFMPVRHFDEPVITYCRPLAENVQFFGVTLSITNVVVRRDRVTCGGPEPRWINSCIDRPMPRHSIHGRQEWRNRDDYRPRLDNNRLSCYSPRVRADWNDGIRPSRAQGRLDEVRVVGREKSFRREFSQRYHNQRDQRRARASVALQNEPTRHLAERHADLEKVRARRVVAEDTRDNRRGRDQLPPDRTGDGIRPAAETITATPSITKGRQERQEAMARRAEKRTDDEPVARHKNDRPAIKDTPTKPVPPSIQIPEKAQEGSPRREVADRPPGLENQGHADQGRPNTDQPQEKARRDASDRQKAAEARERAEQGERQIQQDQEKSRRDIAERQQSAEADARAEQNRRAQEQLQEKNREEAAKSAEQNRRSDNERRQANEAKERAEQSRRAQEQQNAPKEEQNRRSDNERRQANEAKERAEQSRRTQEQQNAPKEEQNRRNANERRQANEAKERAEQSRRAQERDTNDQRREAADRKRASEERARADDSRRSQEREADERRRGAERRQQAEKEARARSEKADDSPGKQKN